MASRFRSRSSGLDWEFRIPYRRWSQINVFSERRKYQLAAFVVSAPVILSALVSVGTYYSLIAAPSLIARRSPRDPRGLPCCKSQPTSAVSANNSAPSRSRNVVSAVDSPCMARFTGRSDLNPSSTFKRCAETSGPSRPIRARTAWPLVSTQLLRLDGSCALPQAASEAIVPEHSRGVSPREAWSDGTVGEFEP